MVSADSAAVEAAALLAERHRLVLLLLLLLLLLLHAFWGLLGDAAERLADTEACGIDDGGGAGTAGGPR